MAFTLPALPWEAIALEPHISANTLSFHHGKHHNAYVTNLNKMIAGTEFEKMGLEEIIKATSGSDKVGIFNNAAQHFNHSFYWKCMKKEGGGKPTGALLAQIEKDFGSFEAFVDEFKKACATQFGSGWGWLVMSKELKKLQIVKTPNADTPIAHGLIPLLTCDVWEHAYYLDWQNRRPDYIAAFVEHLINWEFVASQM